MKFIDFFSGIGGIRHGLELAGHQCIGFCEYDKYAVASYTSMYLITDDQREFLKTLPLRSRQKEILKEEYRNGEWYANDIRQVHGGDLPRADCWCFGAPCQSFSICGRRAGLEGESGLVREIFRLLDELSEEDRPGWLIYENVRGMLSSNKGWDYAAILSEMERGGYDVEWQNINSAQFVPQNRERIYTVGHNRRFGSRKILPLEGADGENHIQQIGNYLHTKTRDNPNQGRIYYIDGIAPCLNKMDGGGREPCVAMPTFVDLQLGGGIKTTKVSRTLVSRYNKGLTHRVGEISGVAEGRVWVIDRQGRKGKVVSPQGIVPTLRAQTHGNLPELCFKLPEGAENHGNGIYVELPEGFTVYAIWYEKEQCYVTVRKLTPKETFRLQGFSDDLFEKAQFVNSDSQLYKQAGNSVTVPIVEAIGRRI